jgi:NAD(P)-dependent dehydrogenase (short-subunit alcohol dehydrogenase family)
MGGQDRAAMDGQGIIIVGGASGFGLECARMMAERGAAEIALVDRDEQALATAAAGLEGQGAGIVPVAGDIATRPAARAAFDAAASALGRVHALVNCAAIYPRKALLEITDEEWDAENAVNIKGTYHMMAAAVEHMKQHVDPPAIAGRIVNITSVDAFKAHPQNAHYAATKAAVVSLTRSFAHAFAADQILVNSVAPAGMATERAKAAGFLGELAAANPLGRAAEPAEMAEWVVMLASSRNTYMTGENVIVSGGYIYA